eukprot:1568032-Prymnesium_polylepis.1
MDAWQEKRPRSLPSHYYPRPRGMPPGGWNGGTRCCTVTGRWLVPPYGSSVRASNVVNVDVEVVNVDDGETPQLQDKHAANSTQDGDQACDTGFNKLIVVNV